ncbi:MAG: hypothetical protein Q7N50_14420 [Armatimonadota bacterium]|nr:hypothetical protein [Armatimonadota bacterium]
MTIYRKLVSLIIVALTLICSEAIAETKIDQTRLLDRSAAFTFAIMSDNKGDSPSSKPRFRRMAQWIKDSDCKFVIGLGDLVKRGLENSFLTFVKSDNWWYNNLYPCVADGENEYYGKDQGDWGAGGKILDVTNLRKRHGVVIRPNNCEYYAKIPIGEYNVHIVMGYFSDMPADIKIAFKEDSRQWIADTVTAIKKGPRDIVIAGAHSGNGSWIEVLSESQRQALIKNADMVLSATTHFWQKIDVPGHEWDGPLCINTGSITYPAPFSKAGYVQVHVLDNPKWLVVQYIDCDAETRSIQPASRCYIKEIGGPIFAADLAAR